MHLVNESEIDIFCEICYEITNATLLDRAQGRTHLRTRLREGTVHMTCPGYQCDTKLGPSTLLSLLHVTEVAQTLRRACEDEVEISPTAKWCPSPGCITENSTGLMWLPAYRLCHIRNGRCNSTQTAHSSPHRARWLLHRAQARGA